MAATFNDVSQAGYVLTTFTRTAGPSRRRSGSPGRRPGAGDHREGLLESQANPQHPRVTLAVCDMRGNVKGEPVEAVASVLEDSQTDMVYRAINNRYGIVGKVFSFFSKLRGGAGRTVGLRSARPDLQHPNYCGGAFSGWW